MLSANNILSPAHGAPLATPTQDMVLGAYYLTYGPDGEELDELGGAAATGRRARSAARVPHRAGGRARPTSTAWSSCTTWPSTGRSGARAATS